MDSALKHDMMKEKRRKHMIDSTSKKVLHYLYNLPDFTFNVNKQLNPPDFLSWDSFLSCLEYLEQEGYIRITRIGENQAFLSAVLTHKGRHFRAFNSIALKRYLLDKWIDLIALIISIIALLGAYRHEISALLHLLMPG